MVFLLILALLPYTVAEAKGACSARSTATVTRTVTAAMGKMKVGYHVEEVTVSKDVYMTVYAPEKPMLKAVPADNPVNPENSGDVVDSEFASNRDDPEDAGDLEDSENPDNVESSDNVGNTAESETTEKSEDPEEERDVQPDYDNSYFHGDTNLEHHVEGPAPAAPGPDRQPAKRPTVTVTEDIHVTITVEPPREVIQQAPMHNPAANNMATTGQDDVPAVSAAFPTVPDDPGLPEAEEEAPSIPSPAEEAPLPAPAGSALPSNLNAPVPEMPSAPDPTDITEAPLGSDETGNTHLPAELPVVQANEEASPASNNPAVPVLTQGGLESSTTHDVPVVPSVDQPMANRPQVTDASSASSGVYSYLPQETGVVAEEPGTPQEPDVPSPVPESPPVFNELPPPPIDSLVPEEEPSLTTESSLVPSSTTTAHTESDESMGEETASNIGAVIPPTTTTSEHANTDIDTTGSSSDTSSNTLSPPSGSVTTYTTTSWQTSTLTSALIASTASETASLITVIQEPSIKTMTSFLLSKSTISSDGSAISTSASLTTWIGVATEAAQRTTSLTVMIPARTIITTSEILTSSEVISTVTSTIGDADGSSNTNENTATSTGSIVSTTISDDADSSTDTTGISSDNTNASIETTDASSDTDSNTSDHPTGTASVTTYTTTMWRISTLSSALTTRTASETASLITVIQEPFIKTITSYLLSESTVISDGSAISTSASLTTWISLSTEAARRTTSLTVKIPARTIITNAEVLSSSEVVSTVISTITPAAARMRKRAL